MAKNNPNAEIDDLPGDVEVSGDGADERDVDMAIVLVSRDSTTTTPTTVFEAEIPILEAIHGEEAITVHRQYTGKTRMNAAELHAQLLTKYRQNHDEAKAIYPTPRAIQRATGLPFTKGDALLAKPKQASVMVGGVEVDPADAGIPPAE